MNLSGRLHCGPVGLKFPASSGQKCTLSPASSISSPRLIKLTAALTSHQTFQTVPLPLRESFNEKYFLRKKR